MASLQLKQRGEVSPHLAEFRARYVDSHPAPSPVSIDQTPAPSTKSEVIATPNFHGRHTTHPSNCDSQTPPQSSVAVLTDRGSSAPSSLHSSRGLSTPVELKGCHEKRERLAVTPTLPDNCGRARANVGHKHPLVTTTRSVGQDKTEPFVAKRAQEQPSPPTHRDTTPPYVVPTKQVTSKKGSDSTTPKQSEIESETVTDSVTGNECVPVSGPGTEEARKRRQEQQRLQKEKWQRRYGLGVKRDTEGDPNSGEAGLGGVATVVMDNDDLISAGETNNYY